MPVIYVDGQALEVKQGENLLESCLNAGLDLPYFCWHPAMGSIGSCRQCAVVQYQGEEDTRGRIVMGCMTPVTEGARFSLQTESVTEFREAIIESLMLNHPHDCPVCAEGGECHLQDMTVMVGHRDRRYRGRKNTHRNQDLGPLIHHEMNRCITCYRCVRYYRDYAGGTDLSAQASHDHTYFGRHQDGVLENEFSGNLVEVCPTGVFTDKTLLKQYTRKWDLQSAPSICTGCAVGCNTIPSERYGKLKRVHNRYHNEVNGYFLCDRGRFGSGYINGDQRLNFSAEKNAEGSFTAIQQERALALAVKQIQSGNGKIAAIGSPRASLEANFLLQELVGADNFSCGFSAQEHTVVSSVAEILQTTAAINPSIKQMEKADAILILGEDVTNTAPRVALGLRQAVRNKAYELAAGIGLMDWQDAAVRNLAQDQRSPMIIASATETRLDDVASRLLTLAPDAIASFGQQVAKSLAGEAVDSEQAKQVAKVLKSAKRPLIISGCGLLHGGIVESAAAIGASLVMNNAETMLSYCLAEVNTLGVAFLAGKPIESIISSEIDTVIVLENDLSRRLTASQIDQLSGKSLIALDVVETPILDICSLVLASASYAESQGTMISSEGRAQRYYPVMQPADQRCPSWQWLLKLASALDHPELGAIEHFDQVVKACANSQSIFSALSTVSPDGDFRSHGQKIPRQTHRYSGRTAMRADVSVHEPQQPADSETPLGYTMEGLNRDQPASLNPFFWSPGWNSNQSVQKFQAEVDGPLKGGPAGVRLLEPQSQPETFTPVSSCPASTELQPHKWHLVPVYRVHGSNELSMFTDEIAELAGKPFIAVGEVVANRHGVIDGDGLIVTGATVSGTKGSITLEVKIIKRLAKNCVGYSVGYAETLGFQAGELVGLEKDNTWQRSSLRSSPQMIASDRVTATKGGNHG